LYLFVVKIQQLYNYPTNIDLNFNYVNSLRFPAVTICNLNQYRSVVRHAYLQLQLTVVWFVLLPTFKLIRGDFEVFASLVQHVVPIG